MKNLILFIAFALSIFANVFGQEEKIAKGGVVNGRATYLPIPNYPQEAKNFCASGKVEVEVLIGENGNVIEAKAISGDELLRNSAVEAAKKAKFSRVADGVPVKTRGIVVYNFDSLSKCVTLGIVNKKAQTLPKPQIGNIIQTGHPQLTKEEIVVVQIIVDMEGKVTYAKAISGHPLLRPACESAARQTKFAPTFIDSSPIKIKALLVYKIKPDGTIDTDIESDDKTVIGTPITLVEPSPPFCNCKFGENPSVLLQAKVDEKGIVTEAMALSGHSFLKNICEKAALESKFLPTNIKSKITFIYHFESIGEGGRAVKIKNIEIKEVKL